MMRHIALGSLFTLLAAATACGFDPLAPIREPIREQAVPFEDDANDDASDDEEDVIDDVDDDDIADPVENDVQIGDIVGDCGYAPATFAVARDVGSCVGTQAIRFDERYGMYVGVTTCGANDVVRVYLSEDEDGPFLPVADGGGSGEDHCELVNPALTADMIRPTMVDGSILLQDVDTWARYEFGEAFERRFAGPDDYWAYTGNMSCGIDVTTCAITQEFAPPDLDNIPPAEDVPCSIGGTSTMSYVIPALEMERGAGVTGGDGLCIADVVFFDPPSPHTIFRYDSPNNYDFTTTSTTINGWSNACNDYHCGIIVEPDGSVNDAPCDVIAFCDTETGLARSVDFTW